MDLGGRGILLQIPLYNRVSQLITCTPLAQGGPCGDPPRGLSLRDNWKHGLPPSRNQRSKGASCLSQYYFSMIFAGYHKENLGGEAYKRHTTQMDSTDKMLVERSCWLPSIFNRMYVTLGLPESGMLGDTPASPANTRRDPCETRHSYLPRSMRSKHVLWNASRDIIFRIVCLFKATLSRIAKYKFPNKKQLQTHGKSHFL